MARALSRFTIEPDADGYKLHIEDEDGEIIEMTATAEQLDLVAEAINEHLEGDYDDIDEAEEE